MLSGGGSGGPVTPLLAVAKELHTHQPETDFVFVGSHNGPEKTLVLESSKSIPITFIPISSGKLRRYLSWKNFTDIFNIGGAFFQSIYILKKEKPSLVMSAGAFVSVPLVWAAKLLNIPVLIHQQDVRPGLANRLMASAAKIISVTFEDSLHDYGAKAVVTGNPFICPALENREAVFKEYNLDLSRPLVLIFGGATGATAINEAVAVNLDELLKFTQIIHVSGDGKINSASKFGYFVAEFLPYQKLISVMTVADLIVARAGLATITELSALKKPSILVPIVNTQQEDNAKMLSDRKATLVLSQTELNDKLTNEVKDLLNSDNKQQELITNISVLNKPGAAGRIADLALSLIK